MIAKLQLGLEGLLVAFLILLLHRIPILYLIKPLVSNIKSNLDVLFAGWFGPIGVAAFYYFQFSMIQTGIQNLWPIVSLVICVSIVLHGITATPFTRLYGKLSSKESKQDSEVLKHTQKMSEKSEA